MKFLSICSLFAAVALASSSVSRKTRMTCLDQQERRGTFTYKGMSLDCGHFDDDMGRDIVCSNTDKTEELLLGHASIKKTSSSSSGGEPAVSFDLVLAEPREMIEQWKGFFHEYARQCLPELKDVTIKKKRLTNTE